MKMKLVERTVFVVVLLLTQQTFINYALIVNNDDFIYYLAQIDSVLDYVKSTDRVDYTFSKLINAEEKDDVTFLELELVRHCPPEETVCLTHQLKCFAQVNYEPSTKTYFTQPNILCEESVSPEQPETTTASATTVQTTTEEKEIVEEVITKTKSTDCLGCVEELNKNVEGGELLVETAMKHIKSERDQIHVPIKILKIERQVVAGIKYSLYLEIAPTVCTITYLLENCPLTENHVPEFCKIVFIEQPWINKEKRIISNNCTVSQDFSLPKIPNDFDNEINTDYKDPRPGAYDEDISDKRPNFNEMAENGNIDDEAARLAEIEGQIVSSSDIQAKKVNTVAAARPPTDFSKSDEEVMITTTEKVYSESDLKRIKLVKILLNEYAHVLGSDPSFWNMFYRWTPNIFVERFKRQTLGGKQAIAVDDPEVLTLTKSTLLQLDGKSSHNYKYKIDKIHSATSQVVSGFAYEINVDIVLSDCQKSEDKDTDLCGANKETSKKTCKINIWDQSWLPEGRKTDVKCGLETFAFRSRRSISDEDSKSIESKEVHEKDSKSSESSEELVSEGKRFKRDRLVGAPQAVDNTDTDIEKLTKSTLVYYDKKTSHDTKYKLSKIKEASKQVVSGILYKITAEIVLTDCPKSSNLDASACGIHPHNVKKTCKIEIWDQPWLPQGRKTKINCDGDDYNFRSKRSVLEWVDDESASSSEEKKTNLKKRSIDESTSSSEEQTKPKINKRNVDESTSSSEEQTKHKLSKRNVDESTSSSEEQTKHKLSKRNVDESTSSSEEQTKARVTKRNVDESNSSSEEQTKNKLSKRGVDESNSSSSEEQKKDKLRKRSVDESNSSSSEEQTKSKLRKRDVDESKSSSEEHAKTIVKKRSVDDSSASSEDEEDIKKKNKKASSDYKKLLKKDDDDSIFSSNSEDTYDRKKRAVTEKNNDDSSSSSSSSDDDNNNNNNHHEKKSSKKANYKEEKKHDDRNDSSSSSSSDDDNGNGNQRHKRNLDEHNEKALVMKLAKVAAENLNDANNKNQVLEIIKVNKLELEGAVYHISARLGVGHCSGIESCLIDEEKLCKFKVHVSKNLANIRVLQSHCHKIEKDSDKNRTIRREKRQPPQKKMLKHLEQFKNFVKEHNKVYKSYTDFQVRFKIFLKNMKTVETLNREEQGTAVYGATKFADMTRKEFQQYLGYREDLRHENDILYSDAVIPDIDLPEAVDWREKNIVTHVKDQKQCGSCWAFSVTGNVEGQYAIKYGKLLELSEQELVDCDKYDSGCNGGLMDNAYRAIEQLGGLETEDDYPYHANDEKCHFNKTLAKVRLSGAVNISQDETDMAKWLTQNGPMAIALNANAMQFYMGGVSHPMKFLCSPNELDHGVLIVGFGTHTYPKFNKTLPYWIVKNSWGPKWGEQGYYRVYRGDGTCGVNQMVSSGIVE